MNYNSLIKASFVVFSYLLLCFFISFHALAQQKPIDITTEKSGIEEFKQSVAKAISNEKEKLDELKRQLSAVEETQKALKEELSDSAIQVSARNNLLLLQDTRIKDLEEARAITQVTIASLSDKIKKFEQRAVTVDLLLLKTTELFLANESQLKEFKDQNPRTEPMQSIIKELQVLSTLFSSKKATLDKIQQIHQNNIHEFNLSRKALVELIDKFESQIQLRKKEELFNRTSDIFFNFGIKPLLDEFSQVMTQIASFFSRSFWENELSIFLRTSDFYAFSSLLLFLISILLFFRIGRHIDRFLQNPRMEAFSLDFFDIESFQAKPDSFGNPHFFLCLFGDFGDQFRNLAFPSGFNSSIYLAFNQVAY
jgi:hypothetical protein